MKDFNSVGNEGAVCVKSGSGDFGVLLYTNTGIGCVTCKYGKSNCQHVRKMITVIDSTTCSEDIPSILIPFAAAKGRTKKQTLESQLSCVSVERVLFKTQSSLTAVITQPLEVRFNISDSICHLKEDVTIQCSKCGQSTWTEVPGKKQGIVLLPTSTLQAIVYSKQCSTPECDGKVNFDGSRVGLLNMKTFLVSHEVLRSYMYHFLMGRTPGHRSQ